MNGQLLELLHLDKLSSAFAAYDNVAPSFIINEEGSCILCVKNPRLVLVPLVDFNESDVGDRIRALLDAALVNYPSLKGGA